MSLKQAHAFAFSLATTLMAAIVVFRAGDGTLSVTPAAEYDGDDAAIVGDVDYVRKQITEWEAAGVTMMVVSGRNAEQIRELASLV